MDKVELFETLKPFLLQLVIMLLQGLDAWLQKKLPNYKGKDNDNPPDGPGGPTPPPVVASGDPPVQRATSPVDAEAESHGGKAERGNGTSNLRSWGFGGSRLATCLLALVLILPGCQSAPVNKPTPLLDNFPQASILGAKVKVEVDVITLNRPINVLKIQCQASALPPGIRCQVD